MGSLCDGADCFGIDTSLDGNACLTNAVRCKDGVLTVASQGSRFMRFAAGADGDPIGEGPLDIPVGATTATGPHDPTGAFILLQVPFTNPFCSRASLAFHYEFGCTFGASSSDSWSFNGDANIIGTTARFYENLPPFAAPTPLTTYQIALTGYDGTIAPIADNDLVIKHTQHGTYTLLGECDALETFSVGALVRMEFAGVTGGFRSIIDYHVALSVLCTAKL